MGVERERRSPMQGWIPGPQDHDLTQRQMLHQLTHPDIPGLFFLKHSHFLWEGLLDFTPIRRAGASLPWALSSLSLHSSPCAPGRDPHICVPFSYEPFEGLCPLRVSTPPLGFGPASPWVSTCFFVCPCVKIRLCVCVWLRVCVCVYMYTYVL